MIQDMVAAKRDIEAAKAWIEGAGLNDTSDLMRRLVAHIEKALSVRSPEENTDAAQ